jgi:hypothetical protein
MILVRRGDSTRGRQMTSRTRLENRQRSTVRVLLLTRSKTTAVRVRALPSFSGATRSQWAMCIEAPVQQQQQDQQHPGVTRVRRASIPCDAVDDAKPGQQWRRPLACSRGLCGELVGRDFSISPGGGGNGLPKEACHQRCGGWFGRRRKKRGAM